MDIFVNSEKKTFHLQNDTISYILMVLPDGSIGQLYFGRRLENRDDFTWLFSSAMRSFSACTEDDGFGISPEHVRLEYPVYGSGDFRQDAVEVRHEDGSRLAAFEFESCDIRDGKPRLEGLPATYTESPDEAKTLCLHLTDPKSGLKLELYYSIFAAGGVIARSARFVNNGNRELFLERAMSMCLDLPDSDYEWIRFAGAWARERVPVSDPLSFGIQSVESLRGHSSHHQNPFIILKRRNTDEFSGECMGFSLVYSGNFLAAVQVDPYDVTRILMGIHPQWFTWRLRPGEAFQTPEAVIAFSGNGLNHLSQTLHDLYRKRLVRGKWRDRPRPILLNNWEATYFDFNEEKLLAIARKAKECGIELFVLDDGWFGKRRSDRAGLGDWTASKELLPDGIAGLSEKVTALGLKFGLWIEPEMVNPDSDLYRAHPDWVLHIPQRRRSLSRHQLVLDFSRGEVADYIFGMLDQVLSGSKISYIKWDMNRSITECGSAAWPASQQGEVFHRQILGVYALYERLIQKYPEILFESCAGGGGRFDAGMLYYAPQAWTSDDTDAAERIRIQYGTSYGYPLVSMGSHVSAVPNHQLHRMTSLKTRAEVAFFGTFGYELDLNRLSEKEQKEAVMYTRFMKKYRELIQFGRFYRLRSPFTENVSAWMVTDDDKKKAVTAVYRTLAEVNTGFLYLRLPGLDPCQTYLVYVMKENGRQCFTGTFGGDELAYIGLPVSDASSGLTDPEAEQPFDFASRIYVLEAVEK